MFEFQWPLVFLALPLPYVIRRLVPKRESKPPSLKVPFFAAVSRAEMSIGIPPKTIMAVAALAWFALICAASRPVWIEERVQVPITGRDLLIALDISGSMQRQDFSAGYRSRFMAVREMAGEFVARRVGDRVGLILFGSQPYLYTPLTFDLNSVVEFLNHARVGFAGQQTAIGDTIGLAVKVLRERPAENRILILLTDGDNSAGSIEPLEGMRLAVEHGVRIFVIGIGIDHTAARVADHRGSNDLPRIAQATGGVYFHASNAAALEEIYAAIDAFEPIDAGQDSQLLTTELYPWPLAVAMVLAIIPFTHRRFANFGTRLRGLREEDADAV